MSYSSTDNRVKAYAKSSGVFLSEVKSSEHIDDSGNQDSIHNEQGNDKINIDLTTDFMAKENNVESGIALTAAVNIDILRAFVPLNILSDDHLNTVARATDVAFFIHGHQVADANLLQENQIFLLSGCVAVEMADGKQERIFGGSDSCHLSIGDRFPHAVAVQAVEDSQLIILERNKLDAMLCWDQVAKTLAVDISADRQFDEDIDWMNTLLCSNLFHKIPPYNVKEIFDQFEPRVVQSGEAIVREGEQGDVCYIIKEGHAVVTCSGDNVKPLDRNEQRKSPQIVARLGAGRCFGEDALLNKTTRNATVTMESNGVLMCLRKRDFLSLMAEPDVAAIDLEQAEKMLASGARWLDVRSQQEYDNAHKDGAFHLPMHLMGLKSRLMDNDTDYIAYCSTGRRASTVAYLLAQQGFKVHALGSRGHPA